MLSKRRQKNEYEKIYVCWNREFQRENHYHLRVHESAGGPGIEGCFLQVWFGLYRPMFHEKIVGAHAGKLDGFFLKKSNCLE